MTEIDPHSYRFSLPWVTLLAYLYQNISNLSAQLGDAVSYAACGDATYSAAGLTAYEKLTTLVTVFVNGLFVYTSSDGGLIYY